MKRSFVDAQGEQNRSFVRKKPHGLSEGNQHGKQCDIITRLPLELVEIIFKKGNLSRQDIINISMTSSSHRARFFMLVFQSIKITWGDFERFDKTFKHKDLIRHARIYSDLSDIKKTTFGEWNISMRNLLLECTNLWKMIIEVMTSARCLKYQDKFDVDLSDKITSLTLISHANEAADESLFELSQLQKFHNLSELKLNGFFINKDQYFYPKFKPDLSDYAVRSLDGKVLNLKHLKLVNCRWEHPSNLSDIFSPNYPSPNPVLICGREKEKFTAPSSISIFYSEESAPFVVSERFRNFVNNDNDEQFLFQTQFYSRLKQLSIVILNRKELTNPERYDYYYPWIGQLGFRRKFHVHSEASGEIECRSILTSLERLTLVGWRLSNLSELEKAFKTDGGMKYNMKHITLYIMPVTGSGAENRNEEELKGIKKRLEEIFNAPGINNNHCTMDIGYAYDCLKDHRYDQEFSKYN